MCGCHQVLVSTRGTLGTLEERVETAHPRVPGREDCCTWQSEHVGFIPEFPNLWTFWWGNDDQLVTSGFRSIIQIQTNPMVITRHMRNGFITIFPLDVAIWTYPPHLEANIFDGGSKQISSSRLWQAHLTTLHSVHFWRSSAHIRHLLGLCNHPDTTLSHTHIFCCIQHSKCELIGTYATRVTDYHHPKLGVTGTWNAPCIPRPAKALVFCHGIGVGPSMCGTWKPHSHQLSVVVGPWPIYLLSSGKSPFFFQGVFLFETNLILGFMSGWVLLLNPPKELLYRRAWLSTLPHLHI